MRSRWALCALLVAGWPDRLCGQRARDAGVGFTGSTLAKATYGEIFSHVHTVPAAWDEHIQTKGESDLYVQQTTWQPAAARAGTPIRGRASSSSRRGA